MNVGSAELPAKHVAESLASTVENILMAGLPERLAAVWKKQTVAMKEDNASAQNKSTSLLGLVGIPCECWFCWWWWCMVWCWWLCGHW